MKHTLTRHPGALPLGLLAFAALAAPLSTPAHALEFVAQTPYGASSAGAGNTIASDAKMSGLQSQVNAQNALITQLQGQVSGTLDCAAQGKLWNGSACVETANNKTDTLNQLSSLTERVTQLESQITQSSSASPLKSCTAECASTHPGVFLCSEPGMMGMVGFAQRSFASGNTMATSSAHYLCSDGRWLKTASIYTPPPPPINDR